MFIVVLAALLHALTIAGCSQAQTAPSFPAAPRPAQLLLEVTEPLGVARHRWPISTGVPFAPGQLREVSQLSIGDAGGKESAGVSSAAQSRVLSRWPDGSVRWALLDWQTDLRPQQTRRFRVDLDNRAPAAPQGGTLRVDEHSDRLVVDTGALQFVVPKQHFAILEQARVEGKPILSGPVLAFMNIDGKRIEAQPPATVTITERGARRLRIELRGRYATTFDYVVRIDAFANQPFVRVLHTLIQRSSEAYSLVRQIAIELPLQAQKNATYRIGREQGAPLTGTVSAAGFALVQEDNERLRTGTTSQAGRAAGWAALDNATGGVAVAARFFWQEYPQGFQVRPSGLTYNLWAPEAAPARIGMGAAKTHEMVISFHGSAAPPAELLPGLAHPLPARVDPDWIAATGALPNSVSPGGPAKAFLRELEKGYRHYAAHAETEPWDSSGQVTCLDPAKESPRRGFYGMLNWGDWNYPGYHDTTKGCDAWGNLEYDMTQVLALAYAATGERAYHEQMVAAARHFMDVDRIYYQKDHPNWVGMNHPKNPLHFAFELGGVDLGHTWTEGLLSYYCLTGDERGLEAARGIADYLVARVRAGLTRGNPRQWGWPQIALMATYEATGNDAYKSAALDYARQGMKVHPPNNLTDWKMGILAEALTYTHAVTHDAAIRDWLEHYATAVRARGATVDPRFMPALAYVGQLTGKREDLQASTAAVGRLTFGTWGKPFTIAGRIGFRVLSLAQSLAGRQR